MEQASLMERQIAWQERFNKSLLGNGEDLVGTGLTQEEIKSQISLLHFQIKHRHLSLIGLREKVSSEETVLSSMRKRVELLERKITTIKKCAPGESGKHKNPLEGVSLEDLLALQAQLRKEKGKS